ncbi:hypothetical protein ACE38V_10590 [Cytobacillus sp. Hz8]
MKRILNYTSSDFKKMNVSELKLAIRGRSHTYTRMAASILR